MTRAKDCIDVLHSLRPVYIDDMPTPRMEVVVHQSRVGHPKSKTITRPSGTIRKTVYLDRQVIHVWR